MRTGFAAAKEAMDKAKNSGGGFARRLDYFNLKDGESVVVRFLTDEPLTVDFYEYVFDVKGKPLNLIVTREGDRTDTVYNIVPKREDPEFDITELQARYGYGTGKTVEGEELTPTHPDRFLYCPMTLEEWAEDHASEKRVRHFLVGDDSNGDGDNSKTTASRSNGSTSLRTGDDEAQAAPPPDTSQDLSDLRARLERHK
jgi:hypothetical protein